jgi:dUTPase
MSYFANIVDSNACGAHGDGVPMMSPSFKSGAFAEISKKCTSCMVLKIFVNGSSALQELYEKAIIEHNLKIVKQEFVDAGFDLYAPLELDCVRGNVIKVDFHIQCAASIVHFHEGRVIKEFHTGYYLYPRSSLSKTSLRLANSVGIIDSGYRGDIIGMFDCINVDYKINRFDRLAQICSPGLTPIFVEMVENDVVLGASLRGAGGFGSSGR